MSDAALCAAVSEMAQGLIDADLGGTLVKKRVALPGRGKSGGARTLVATNKGNRWFFLFGFEKNERGNVTPRSLRRSRRLPPTCWDCPLPNWTPSWQAKRYRRFAMATKTRAKSRILESVHETAQDLHAAGFIDMRRMREYDVLYLAPVPDYSSAKIRALRQRYRLSQAVFASVLNTSLSTVRQWEIGEKHPSGPSLKLLHLLDRKGLEAVI